MIGQFRAESMEDSKGDQGHSIEHLKTKPQRGQFTALGSLLTPEIGITYKFYGSWGEDPKFGKQFKFQHYEVMKPSSTRGIFQYLVRVCKYVGPTVAGRLIGKYKENTLEVLRQRPEQVAAEIKGITPEKAIEIQQQLKEHEITEKAVVELEDIFSKIAGVRKNLPFELVKIWGADAVARLKANPYSLTRIRGIGFATADHVAMHLGFDSKSIKRCKAAIFHVINESMQLEGSTWIAVNLLKERVLSLTDIYSDQALSDLLNSTDVLMENNHVAISTVAVNESIIAKKIMGMVMHEAE